MALDKKLAKSSNDIFSDDGKLAIRSDEDKIFIDSNVVKEIIGEGGGPTEPIPENITLELNTNTDLDPIVNLKYELDGDTLNSPVAFSKDDFKIENNHMRVDAVNGLKIGRNGDGVEGFYKADGSFIPFKSWKVFEGTTPTGTNWFNIGATSNSRLKKLCYISNNGANSGMVIIYDHETKTGTAKHIGSSGSVNYDITTAFNLSQPGPTDARVIQIKNYGTGYADKPYICYVLEE